MQYLQHYVENEKSPDGASCDLVADSFRAIYCRLQKPPDVPCLHGVPLPRQVAHGRVVVSVFEVLETKTLSAEHLGECFCLSVRQAAAIYATNHFERVVGKPLQIILLSHSLSPWWDTTALNSYKATFHLLVLLTLERFLR